MDLDSVQPDEEKFLLTNLKQARMNAGYTQADIAKISHIGQGRISEFERGERSPEAVSIIKLARALNCSTDYLLGLSDNPGSGQSGWDALFEGKEATPNNGVSKDDMIDILKERLADKDQLIKEKDRRIADLELLVEAYKRVQSKRGS